MKRSLDKGAPSSLATTRNGYLQRLTQNAIRIGSENAHSAPAKAISVASHNADAGFRGKPSYCPS